jgi:pimeloyl-ACP methyl ester carboxylesterase
LKERNFQLIETNGVRLRVVVEGKGPLVILLHGFPQCWYLWRHQIDPLVEAGFQVAAPDQRGYGGSDRPAEIEAYNIIDLTNDVVGLADALGHERFIVVGHDWGAPVASHTALLYPQRVRAVVGMSVPYTRWRAGTMTRQETAKIEQPSFFIAGKKDPVLSSGAAFGGGSWLSQMDDWVTDLRGKVFIEGAGHWVQMERPAEVNEALLGFLRAVS